MSHRAVAANAFDCFTAGVLGVDGFADGFMAIAAAALGDGAVTCLDADGLMKPAGGECPGMAHAVGGLVQILGDKTLGSVAVVAHRGLAVARAQPSAVLLLHDMAIGAGRRIVGQIGRAFGIDESKAADAGPGRWPRP